MPKAALVMDMPETCENCACKYPSYKDDALYDCAITGKESENDKLMMNAGFNACLDEILKERDADGTS